MLPPGGADSVKGNRLLAGLQAADRALLAPAFRIERLSPNHLLSSRIDPVTDIWFPHSGVIALSITDNQGRTVQTGVVGREGCVGLENMFLHTPLMADASVQIAGEMSVISAPSLRSAIRVRPSIQIALALFLFALSAQSLQTTACNRLHTLEERGCRWLLMMRDRTDEDDLPLPQESLAAMLGSGRPRINVLLAALEQHGLIQRYRGRIRLLNRSGLEGRACECDRQLSHR
jgi:CRP-like cAMP-binding protein